MSYSGILADIKAILQTVPGAGDKIYDYERWSADWDTYLTLFKADGIIKGFTITRNKTTEEAQSSRTNWRIHTFIIRMFYALKDSDASEKKAQNLVEDIASAFRSKPELLGSCIQTSPVQVDVFEPRMFGSVLCHYAELRLNVTEEIQYPA